MAVDRIEVWSDLICASGTHQATLAPHEVLEATLSETIEGKAELQVMFDRAASAWSSLQCRRVLVVRYTDASVQEYRIVKPAEERRASDGAERAIVTAEGVLMDLANGIVSRTEADGTVSLFYTLLSQTRSALVTHILAGAPTHFTAGTIDNSSNVVDAFTFSFDTPLRALQELAAIEGLELAVRRNGSTDYYVDLVAAVGSSATQPEFRYRKQLKGIRREVDGSELANRIYAAGGGDAAIRLSLGDASFEVTTVVSSTVVELSGDPIFVDDHLVGEYLETPGGTKIQITDSDATLQRVTTASAHGLAVGDRIKFRDDAAGLQLQYVEDPDSQATYGVMRAVIEETDLPPVANYIANAALREWSSGMPVNWTKVGTPTVAEETQEKYTRVGGKSAKVTATAAGQGIETAAVTISPSDPLVFFSFLASIFVESGEVELYATHSVDGDFPAEGAAEQAYTSETGVFIDLKVEGKEWQSGTVKLVILARNGAATFYVDAAQLENAAGLQPFFEGHAGEKLWGRAIDALLERSTPQVTYAIDVMDLTAADATSWPYDEITLGGTVLVEDEQLSLQVTTRALAVKRDLLEAHDVKLELSNRSTDLIDLLTSQRRRRRQDFPARPSIARIGQFKASVKPDGSIVLQVFGAGATRSFRYICDIQTMATYAEVIAAGGDGVTSNVVDGTEVVVSDIRDAGTTKLAGNQRAYIRIVVYPIVSAGGTPGATDQVVTQAPTYWYAEITGTEIIQYGTSPNIAVRRSFDVDKRTSAVRVYRRKGNWPTKNSTQGGELDPAYDRGTIDARDGWEYTDAGWATNDVVYDIAVAIDPNGHEGEREEFSTYTVGASASPRIISVSRQTTQWGTACTTGNTRQVQLTWSLGDCTDGGHDIKVYRVVDGGPKILVGTETSPVTNTTMTDTAAPMYDGGSEHRFVDYVVELWDTVPAKIDEKTSPEDETAARWYLCETPE